MRNLLLLMGAGALLFTQDGHQILGMAVLLPLVALADHGEQILVPIGVVALIYVFRARILAWQHTRQLGERIK